LRAERILSPQPHILFVSTFRTPFIDDDLRVLAEDNRVTLCIGHGPRQALDIVLGVLHTQLTFCWFASVYAAIATIVAGFLGKQSIIVVGGVDMAKEKEYGYGLWLSPWKSALARKAIKKAARVLVVDQSLKDEILQRVKYNGDNIEVLPTGFDHELWQASGTKERLVVTVAAVQNEGRMKIKGIDILFEVARKLPLTKFVLIGFDAVRFKDLVPPANLSLYPVLDHSELLQYYRRAKVYCQPSRREGLSNTLCEAMLCECIPVVTDVGGSARAVGETGIVVRPNDSAALAAAVDKALGMPENKGRQARERIIGLFPKKKREKRLKELIREISQ
jgi:glycosyltransferase involved in cell wall biosynthesis